MILPMLLLNIKAAQERQKLYYDKSHRFDSFAKDELVWLDKFKSDYNKKLSFKFRGPYRVLQRKGEQVYLIQALNNTSDVQKVNLQRLKRCLLDKKSLVEYSSEGRVKLLDSDSEDVSSVVDSSDDDNSTWEDKYEKLSHGKNMKKVDRSGDWEVEKIVDVRKTKNGKEFLVKWLGWTKRHNSWVRKFDLNAPDLI